MSLTEHLYTHTLKKKKSNIYSGRHVPPASSDFKSAAVAVRWYLHVLVITTSPAACVIQKITRIKTNEKRRTSVTSWRLVLSRAHQQEEGAKSGAKTRSDISVAVRLAVLSGTRQLRQRSSVKRNTNRRKKKEKPTTTTEKKKTRVATRHSLVVEEAVASVECR